MRQLATNGDLHGQEKPQETDAGSLTEDPTVDVVVAYGRPDHGHFLDSLAIRGDGSGHTRIY